MSDKVKESLLDVFIKGLKAMNTADAKEPEKEPEKPAENGKTAKNEDVDKRKLIDEVGGILKGKVDDEVIRTIIGKLEKVAYDKSEVGTANNCNGKKVKNEEVDPKEPKKDDKPAENDDDKEKEEFKKAQNSLDDVKRLFYQGKYTKPTVYMTQKQGIELGKKLY